VLVGFEPRYEVWSGGSVAVALFADIGIIGKLSYSGSARVTYQAVTLGPQIAVAPLRGVPLLLDLEPGLTVLHQDTYESGSTSIPGETQVRTRLAVGLHLRL